ncbi:lasso peptide biosynthesis B2 protein [Butyrivibrio sp. VCD2006]|uniref:lasso peptide biosynthesis B2 protein n=1 Tax=Butyrivibrio sp. VCD2006 TaxID=1280664 RepID=UPI0004139304|nr:lasso peptide biosynthesis B2 protein [Butyrivibrio sp. VCD2006]
MRALTAQKLLLEKGIESTLYLGCKEDETGKMVAHAWIRCGKAYVTGGNGAADGYAIVEKFRARIK